MIEDKIQFTILEFRVKISISLGNNITKNTVGIKNILKNHLCGACQLLKPIISII